MIPFTNQVCNDSFEDPKLFKSFKIIEITLFAVCFILCVYFIIASFKGEFGVSSKYQLLAKEKALTQELKLLNEKPSSKAICQAVINIRSRKLPNPKELGNSGSFFKNPIIANNKYKQLKKNFPDLVAYKESNTHMKIAAGWLIERAGWKGFKDKNVGVYKNQALVLVNHGNASGQDIINLSKKIQESIFQKFQIEILPEVNII